MLTIACYFNFLEKEFVPKVLADWGNSPDGLMNENLCDLQKCNKIKIACTMNDGIWLKQSLKISHQWINQIILLAYVTY